MKTKIEAAHLKAGTRLERKDAPGTVHVLGPRRRKFDGCGYTGYCEVFDANGQRVGDYHLSSLRDRYRLAKPEQNDSSKPLA